MKGLQCISKTFPGSRAWMISAPLWNAPSEFDFKIAWKEKRRFAIHNLDFTEVLRDGHPEEIDDFGKMLMVASQGCMPITAFVGLMQPTHGPYGSILPRIGGYDADLVTS